MQLANFTLTGQDPARSSGPAELGGIPVHAIFDRTNPGRARLTIRSASTPSARLPERLRSVSAITVAGASVAVGCVELEDGADALCGRLDPALADLAVGLAATPASDAPASAAPASAAGAVPGAAPDRLVELSTQLAAAKAERASHAARVKDLRGEIADLRQRLEIAEGELSSAGDTASEHADRCAELRQQIRDLLDDEEAG